MSEREQTPEERGERRLRPLHARKRAARVGRLQRRRRSRWSRPASLEPDKSSIREALGRAYFHAGRYAQAGEEFAAVVERHPVNDYAHFCLGRSLEKTGRTAEARRHLALAASLRPDRGDYRVYRAADRGRVVARGQRALHHQAEQPVHGLLAEPRHRQVAVHPDVARARAAKRTRRVWRFQCRSCQGSRSSEAASANAWTRSSPSATRTPTSSGQPPASSPATVMPHSPCPSRRVWPGSPAM